MQKKSWFKKRLEITRDKLEDSPKIDWFPSISLAFMCYMLGNFLGKPNINVLSKVFASALVFWAIVFTYYAYSLVPEDEEETDET